MFRSLLDKLFAFINSFRLNDYDEIADTLMDGIREVLDEHDPTFDINVYFTEELDEEDIMAVEESEPGVTKNGHEVVAFTSMDDDGNFSIVFALEAVKRFVTTANPFRLKDEIRGVARHEAYHVRQYRYVYEKGGLEALDRLCDDLKHVDYEENVLEIGAYLFQFFGIEQDFSEDFAPYLNKACA